MVKRSAVATDPSQTSRQRSNTFGNNLKIIANRPLTTTNEIAKSQVCHTAGGNVNRPLMYNPNAASSTLMTSETRSRKPMASTMEKEKKRSWISVVKGRPGLITTPQTEFSESFNSANTVEA